MFEITVNDKPVMAKQGETVLDACKRAGIAIPTLCHMQDLFPSGACRMCVVEIEGQRGLVPSCAFPASEGMTVRTHSPRAIRARKTIVELLLSSHPDDCLYCERSGSCDLQSLTEELGVTRRRYSGSKNTYMEDVSSPAIVRDPSKCILCGKCVRTCEEIMNVAAIDFVGRGSESQIAPAFMEGLNVTTCINCGQCIMACPTGALREQSYIKEVMNALEDPEKFVVVQHAPSVSVSIGEEFGLDAGADVIGLLNAALRKLGFERVFDTAFTADLTIMEESAELVKRIQEGGPLPMMTSCSPGWIKYVEQFYPDLLPNVSTCKSPQQMMGAVIKSFFAEREGIDPEKIYSVSIMPCTAKKFEAARPEMGTAHASDIDAVLTTRELARMIRTYGLDLDTLIPEGADTPFGQRSTAGKIFGASGGVMEAAVRTAYHSLTGRELETPRLDALRGFAPYKEAHLPIGDLEVGVAVVNGIGNAAAVLDEVRSGRDDLHFIEVMTCPGGCINGGGQPRAVDMESAKARMQALYEIDRNEYVRTSHGNEAVQRLYKEFLGEPLGHKSHELLHTHYEGREVLT